MTDNQSGYNVDREQQKFEEADTMLECQECGLVFSNELYGMVCPSCDTTYNEE